MWPVPVPVPELDLAETLNAFSITGRNQQHQPAQPTNMGLFDGLGSNAPASSGTATSNLFGGTAPASTGGTTGNLFGNLGGASTSAPGTSQPAASGTTGGSLFGNLGAAPPLTSSGASGGGLFGGLGAAKTTAPATSSTPAFPPLGGTTAQTAGSGGGLFSKPFGQQGQQSTTANPPSNTQQTNPLGQSTLFGTTTMQQSQEQSGGPLSQSNAGTGRNSHFDNLLERGRKRNVGENGLSSFDELPTLQLGLGDIARKVRNLGAGGPSADQGQDRAA
jgi:nuclear pore complex protein Nup93